MDTILDDSKALVFPYGRYLGKETGKVVLQVSNDTYREMDSQWDSIIKAIADAPDVKKIKSALSAAKQPDPTKYLQNLIDNNILAVVDLGNIPFTISSIYDWVIYPTLTYEGKSKVPALSAMAQIMVSTPKMKTPFNISLFTMSVMTETTASNGLTLGDIVPRLVAEMKVSLGMSEAELLSIFLNDLRKLIQRRGAFLGE